jgi:3D (Asp-Asp-Asp) domain-containing protein
LIIKIRALIKKLKREGKRITAMMCMLATGLGTIIPGMALTVGADTSEEQTVFEPEQAEVITQKVTRLSFDRVSDAYAGAEDEKATVIKKQYSGIFYETQDLSYNTVYLDSDYLPLGARQTVFAGAEGIIEYEKAQMQGEDGAIEVILEAKVIQPAKSAVTLVGTGASAMAAYAVPFEAESVDLDNGTMTVRTGEQAIDVLGVISCKATAYCACTLCCGPGARGITSTGTRARVGSIAVDPSVIPYGTKMFIVSDDGYYRYGYAVAEDSGGAIRGNKIDLFFNTHSEAVNFGRRNCTVYILAP